MKKLLVYLMLFNSLVGFSQMDYSKFNVKVTHPNKKDTVYQFNTRQEQARFLDSCFRKYKFGQYAEKNYYCKEFNMDLMEQELNKLYEEYQEKVFHMKKEHTSFLDSLSYCQLRYLQKYHKDDITHEQNNSKFKTLGNRFDYFYQKERHSVGEILVLINGADNEYNAAKHMFELWLSSKGHKQIIDDKKLKFYNFKCGYNKFGRVVGIGVFSENELVIK